MGEKKDMPRDPESKPSALDARVDGKPSDEARDLAARASVSDSGSAGADEPAAEAADPGSPAEKPPVLEARDLTLSWDGTNVVVRDVSLCVGRGEIICLVGKSGCGKTTILHALSGLVQPMGGQVLLQGEDISGRPGRVSYMLQKDLLIPSKRIIDNACLPLLLQGQSRKEARAFVRILFERFGLAGCERKWPSQLSGGMRQRVAFLRTYVQGNDVALLDEPFSALDAITRTDLRAWYCEMARGLLMSSVVITHDVDEAVFMADRVYVLRGKPREGEPTIVAGTVEVSHARAQAGKDVGDFALTPEFVECKRQVVELLG